MAQNFFVPLVKIIKDLKLKEIYMPEGAESINVSSADVNRPGLQIIGYYDYFDKERIQILGRVETTYLSHMSSEERKKSAELLLEKKIPALIVSRDQDVFPEFLTAAKKYGVPVLSSKHSTSRFMSVLISYLTAQLAPRITVHGVLVEIYGEGALILGESGVGKSETAMELVKRGHRLIADDAVEIKKVSENRLVGTAPEIIRNFIELRGIGIIDVKKIFGMGSVKENERIDIIINLENWNESKHYDRLGLESETTSMLDVKVPSLTIPVKPGRNLAIILEVACMNNKQKRMGYNAAEHLNERLMNQMGQTAGENDEK